MVLAARSLSLLGEQCEVKSFSAGPAAPAVAKLMAPLRSLNFGTSRRGSSASGQSGHRVLPGITPLSKSPTSGAFSAASSRAKSSSDGPAIGQQPL
jgi:hypothetical protein